MIIEIFHYKNLLKHDLYKYLIVSDKNDSKFLETLSDLQTLDAVAITHP